LPLRIEGFTPIYKPIFANPFSAKNPGGFAKVFWPF